MDRVMLRSFAMFACPPALRLAVAACSLVTIACGLNPRPEDPGILSEGPGALPGSGSDDSSGESRGSGGAGGGGTGGSGGSPPFSAPGGSTSDTVTGGDAGSVTVPELTADAGDDAGGDAAPDAAGEPADPVTVATASGE
jgi:hypothetical protein